MYIQIMTKYRKKFNQIPTLKRWIVLVGLPGAGKSALGQAIAHNLNLDFFDADVEISRASNMPVHDIFAMYGEAEFRRLEEQIISRILQGPPAVLSLGGGAFENADTREIIQKRGVSIWLKVEHEIILERILRKTGRPLFDHSEDPKQTLKELAQQREKNFAKAKLCFIPPNTSLEIAARALSNVICKHSAFRKDIHENAQC